MDNSFPTVQEHLSKSNDIRPPLSNTIKRDEEEKNSINIKIWFINFPFVASERLMIVEASPVLWHFPGEQR